MKKLVKTRACKHIRGALPAGCAAIILLSGMALAQAAEKIVDLDIPAQDLATALTQFGHQAETEIAFEPAAVEAMKSAAIKGQMKSGDALETLLADTGLTYEETPSEVLLIKAEDDGRIELAQLDGDDGNQSVNGTADDDAPTPNIVVTGTNIRGVETSASPVFSFDRADIDASGYSTAQDLIQRALPQNFAAGAAEDTAFAVREDSGLNLGQGSGVNLRGLGNDSTLVLVDGRRIVPGGTGSFTDISLLPLSAVERVDVLTDGASAIYGSDAIGGVVNFVLRDDYDGAETRFRYGTVTKGDSDEFQVGQIFGKSWDTGNALLSYEFYDRGTLSAADRDFASASPMPAALLPDQQRHSVLFKGRQELTDTIEIFGTALYSNREADRVDIEQFSQQIRSIASDVEQISVNFGGNAKIGDTWQAELSGSYGRSEGTRLNSVIATGQTISDRISESDFYSVDALVDGDVFEIGGGAVKLAVGGQYRRDELFASTLAAPVPTGSSRDVYAVFGETFIPIIGENNQLPFVDRLEFTAAVRYENYSDFGSSTDPKFGILWSPVEGLSLRGTWGTSFRAPLLTELSEVSNQAVLFPIPDPMAATGSTLSFVLFGNNANLEAEQSESWTVGLDVNPTSLPGLDISVTYFDISFDNRINRVNAFFDAFVNPAVAGAITRNPSAADINGFMAFPFFINPFALDPFTAEAVLDNRLRNFASTDLNGIDLSASYQRSTDAGDFSLSFNGNYLFEFVNQLISSSAPIDVVGTVFNPPALRLRAGGSWSKDGFTVTAFVNHTDDYIDNLVMPNVGVDSWTTVDFQIGYNTEERFGGVLDNTSVSLSIQNLFDADPPFVGNADANDLGFDPENADAIGRYIAIQLTKSL